MSLPEVRPNLYLDLSCSRINGWENHDGYKVGTNVFLRSVLLLVVLCVREIYCWGGWGNY